MKDNRCVGGNNPLAFPVRQVTNQADGAKLLLTLESKRTASLSPAADRLRELLPPAALISEQRDVTTLIETGRSGSPTKTPTKRCSAPSAS